MQLFLKTSKMKGKLIVQPGQEKNMSGNDSAGKKNG